MPFERFARILLHSSNGKVWMASRSADILTQVNSFFAMALPCLLRFYGMYIAGKNQVFTAPDYIPAPDDVIAVFFPADGNILKP